MNKHTATLDGQVFTRNSASRMYAYCVVARYDRQSCETSLIARAERSAKDNYEFLCGRGSNNPFLLWNNKPSTYYVYGKIYTSSEEFMADYPTLQDAIDYQVAKAKDTLNSRTDEYYDKYFVWGWSSRRDLAEKSANSASKTPAYRDVTILDAAVEAYA